MTKRLPVALMGMALLLAPTAVPMSSSLAQAPIGDSSVRPLYAQDAGSTAASDKLKDVDFAPIPGRVGQRIRDYLIFESTGGVQAKTSPLQYRLEVALQENLMSTLAQEGKVSGAIYSVQASFRLIDTKEKRVVFQGASHARAVLERSESTSPTCALARTLRIALPAPSPMTSRHGWQRTYLGGDARLIDLCSRPERPSAALHRSAATRDRART
jgi:LPS-assembly lipoprotein